MEALRTHVLDQLDRHRQIEFSPKPAPPAPAAPKARKNRSGKLAEWQIREIRVASAQGIAADALAVRYRVSEVTIRSIRDRRTWADVPDE